MRTRPRRRRASAMACRERMSSRSPPSIVRSDASAIGASTWISAGSRPSRCACLSASTSSAGRLPSATDRARGQRAAVADAEEAVVTRGFARAPVPGPVGRDEVGLRDDACRGAPAMRERAARGDELLRATITTRTRPSARCADAVRCWASPGPAIWSSTAKAAAPATRPGASGGKAHAGDARLRGSNDDLDPVRGGPRVRTADSRLPPCSGGIEQRPRQRARAGGSGGGQDAQRRHRNAIGHGIRRKFTRRRARPRAGRREFACPPPVNRMRGASRRPATRSRAMRRHRDAGAPGRSRSCCPGARRSSRGSIRCARRARRRRAATCPAAGGRGTRRSS